MPLMSLLHHFASAIGFITNEDSPGNKGQPWRQHLPIENINDWRPFVLTAADGADYSNFTKLIKMITQIHLFGIYRDNE
jgi:hypothetical protein